MERKRKESIINTTVNKGKNIKEKEDLARKKSEEERDRRREYKKE